MHRIAHLGPLTWNSKWRPTNGRCTVARILLDMDGVLCNLIKKWFDRYNQEYRDALQMNALTDWGPHRFAKAGKAIYKYLGQPGFFRDLEPIDGAIAGVRTLIKRGHEIVIVTSAKRGHVDKAAWIREHLPEIPSENMVFTHRKELVRGDLLFDDAPHHLEAFARYGTPVAMAYPYNARVKCARVPNWSAFLQLVDELFTGPVETP